MNDGPTVSRPGYVSLIPGGPQNFPEDPKLEALRQAHPPINPKRRPQEE
jgi:hypothetical protein